ncbi:MAG: SGNH/GDSL hydrolase family protein [Proteobacteria bacterium]|nr:SGNH/GDSL hydrolase family protein [Pseudomonadota bacterium]
MRIVAALLVWTLAASTTVAAAMAESCAVAASFANTEIALPRVYAAMQKKRLTISVAGTSSSTLPGPEGARAAYPARLEAVLTNHLPNVTVRVISHAKSRQTSEDMVKTFPLMLMDDRPDLVIWQTGTVDAIRGVDPDVFRATLNLGADTLIAGGANVLFVNMQFSPRTVSMIAIWPFLESMKFVALERDLPVFDRFSIMRLWDEVGTFDLYSPTKRMETAAKVHDCIAHLLADLIENSAQLAVAAKPAEAPAK